MKYPDDFIDKIICGDCLEVMKKIPDSSIDLVLTDPPYGVRKKEKWDNKIIFLNSIDLWIKECLRVSKTVLWFCSDNMLPDILKNNGKFFKRILFWNKPKGSQFAGAMNSNIWYSIECILLFGEIPKNNKSKKYGFSSFNYRTVVFSKFKHPTTKPLGLMKDLVYFHSNKNDIILDPFLGSGTTVVACKELNRKYIGIEQSKEYCKIAEQRIKKTNIIEGALDKWI